MAYGLSNGHVTDDVTWPPKVLWGSTVGYRSDSLLLVRHITGSWRTARGHLVTALMHCTVQTTDTIR